MHVEIRNILNGQDNLAGILRLRDGRIVAEPDSSLLQGILGQPAADRARRRLYRADSEPAEWLHALHQQYRSAYLRASEPIGGDDGKDGDDDGGAALAHHYAELWNTMQAHGENVTHEHLQDAAEELGETPSRVTHRPAGDWVAHRYDDSAPLRRWKGYEPAIAKEAQHAPKGGVYLTNMQGISHFYVGGQWIPAKEIANLPASEKAKLHQSVTQARHAAKMQRVQRGDVNAEQLRQRLAPHARPLSHDEQKRTVAELRALHKYHGALTLHRIEQLVDQQKAFLRRGHQKLTEKQQKQIKGNLSRLHAMIDLSKALGVTGKVPKELQKQALAATAKQPPAARPKPADYRAVSKPKEEPAAKPAPALAPTKLAPAKSSPMSPEQASAALARQAGHVAQPKEGEDAASELNRKLIAEGKQPKDEAVPESKPAEQPTEKQPETPPKTAEQPQQDESEFHAAWDRILDGDPIAQKLVADGRPDEARARLLRQLMQEGVAIPQRIQEKHAGPYGAALDWLSKHGQTGEEEERLRTQHILSHGPTHREALAKDAKEQREAWSRKARLEGMSAQDLHATADHVMSENKEWRERRQGLLKRARELFARHGYNADALTTNMRRGSVEDDVPALDLVSRTLSHDYPEEFGGDVLDADPNKIGDDQERLLDMFAEGVPPPMSKEDAYEKAFEYMLAQKGQTAEREPGMEDEDEEEDKGGVPSWLKEEEEQDDPFASQWKALWNWLRKSRRGGASPSIRKVWDKAKHPRGQPENKGEFAPKEGEGGAGTIASLKITDDVLDHHHGQTEAQLKAFTDDGKLAAYLDYSIFDKKPQIKMVESQVKGLRAGQQLVEKLADNYGYENIQWGMMTSDGSKLRHSLDQKYGIERGTESTDVDKLAESYGGKILYRRDGFESGSENIYVEFNSVKQGEEFAAKLRELGSEDVDIQEIDGQAWVDGTLVTKRDFVRKKRPSSVSNTTGAIRPDTGAPSSLAGSGRIVGSPPSIRKEWDKGKHPRGQPENKGEFAPKEGGTTSSEGSVSASEPAPAKKRFGKSKAKVKAVGNDFASETEIHDKIGELFGDNASIADIGSLVGAPDDAECKITMTDKGFLKVKVSHPAYEAIRFIGTDPKKGTLYIKNDEFWVKSDKQGAGLGAEVFGRQVENAVEMGVDYIKCHAAKENPREPKKPHNGYYTWPRFGYDQDLEDFDEFDAAEFRLKKSIKKNFPAAKSILDVMATPEGRDWWKKNGDDLHYAKFDLEDGSRSRTIFDAYLDERASRSTKTKGHTGMDRGDNHPQRGVEENLLSADDEQWLDAAWEKLDARRRAKPKQDNATPEHGEAK